MLRNRLPSPFRGGAGGGVWNVRAASLPRLGLAFFALALFALLLAGCSQSADEDATPHKLKIIVAGGPDDPTTRPPVQPGGNPQPAYPPILPSTHPSFHPSILPPGSPAPARPQPRPPGAEPVLTVAAVGDLMFNNFQPQGGLYPLQDVAPVFKSVDVAFANLETPLTDRGSPTPRKSAQDLAEHRQWILRGSPGFAQAVAASGINVVSCANNHDMDWGAVGMLDNIQAMDSVGVVHSGSGMNSAAAHQPAIIQRKGERIAVLSYLAFRSPGGLGACTPSGPDSPGVAIIPCEGGALTAAGVDTLRRDIAAARSRADLVFVSFHWGIEKQPLPTDYQRSLAHAAVDLGADMVLGGHPHVLEPLETYRGAPIIYSLGNFVAPNNAGPLGETLILLTQWRGRHCEKIEVQPVRILGGVPTRLRGPEAEAALQRFKLLSSGVVSRAPARETTLQ